MANEPSQLGSPALALGFGNDTIGIILAETISAENTADIEYVKDENANDAIAVISNKGVRFTAEGYLKSGQTVPAKGDTVTVNSVAYIVETITVRRTATLNRVSLTLYKPAAATWTAPSAGAGSNT